MTAQETPQATNQEKPPARSWLTRAWLVKGLLGPLAVATLAAWVGRSRVTNDRSLAERAAALSEPAFAVRSAAPSLAVANAAWILGTPDAVKQMARFELDHLGEAEGERRARVLVRFGIIDTNPDGQAALFNQACVADPRACDHLKEAAERETRERLVAPGNTLPLYFLGGHPHGGSATPSSSSPSSPSSPSPPSP